MRISGLAWNPPAAATTAGTTAFGRSAAQQVEIAQVMRCGEQAAHRLHRDEDEEAREAPILSISLGDTALFRLGGPTRKSPTRSLRLSSGDAIVLEGPSRTWFHGVDRIMGGSSTLLPQGGRLNLTLRRVTKA